MMQGIGRHYGRKKKHGKAWGHHRKTYGGFIGEVKHARASYERRHVRHHGGEKACGNISGERRHLVAS